MSKTIQMEKLKPATARDLLDPEFNEECDDIAHRRAGRRLFKGIDGGFIITNTNKENTNE